MPHEISSNDPSIEADPHGILRREFQYHETLYAGYAQQRFARSAVKAFRRHLVDRILRITGLHREARVLSLGCGIGDTELLLAPHVREVVGIDISRLGIQQARADAAKLGLSNATFQQATIGKVQGSFDAVIAVFFLHHLAEDELHLFPGKLLHLLAMKGIFYSLDPSARKLSGAIARILSPRMAKKHHTADERELEPEPTASLFRQAGFSVRQEIYDFGSTPLSGLLPDWKTGYRLTRKLDDVLLRLPALRRMGSNFELIATRPD